MFNFSDPYLLIARIPALLIGFAVHEYGHAWMADRLGDPTPRSMGRLTLNPIAHLDFFGTLMALFFYFGWAKPVMTNPSYYRKDKRRGHMMVAAAGPVMNFIIAFFTLLLMYISALWLPKTQWSPYLSIILQTILFLNLCLGVFNLIPIPPLDGFSILKGVMPYSMYNQLYVLERYGFLILLLVLVSGAAGSILWPLVNAIYFIFNEIILLLFRPFLGG